MAWVALPSSGITYNATLPAGVAFDGDNLVATDAENASFTIQFPALDADTDIRITAVSYTAGGGESGNLYHAAEFSANNDDGFVQENTAPPAPASNWPDNDPVAAWTPSPMQTTLQSGNTLTYLVTRTTGDEIPVIESWSFLIEVDVEVPDPPTVSYNCECDDGPVNRDTLANLREALLIRLGFAAQLAEPMPGTVLLVDSFLKTAQKTLYRRYDELRTERFYSWPLVAGVRLYDFPENAETCTKRLDSKKVTWVGLVKDDIWSPLIEGIPPEIYSSNITGQLSRYEIRQCIEVWPAPDETLGSLVIKGHFGLESFENDDDLTTLDAHAVFLLALADAKAHYGKPDANTYYQQLETYISDMVAGGHHTARYVPGEDPLDALVYVKPVPKVPF